MCHPFTHEPSFPQSERFADRTPMSPAGSPPVRGRGAPRDAFRNERPHIMRSVEHMLRVGRAIHDADRPPRDAPRRRQVYAVCASLTARRFRTPEPFFRVWTECAARIPIRQTFVRLRPDRVQQVYLQTLLVGSDGQPEASRARGYEPRPQAPPRSRVSWRPRKRPSTGSGDRNIFQFGRACQAGASPLRGPDSLYFRMIKRRAIARSSRLRLFRACVPSGRWLPTCRNGRRLPAIRALPQ